MTGLGIERTDLASAVEALDEEIQDEELDDLLGDEPPGKEPARCELLPVPPKAFDIAGIFRRAKLDLPPDVGGSKRRHLVLFHQFSIRGVGTPSKILPPPHAVGFRYEFKLASPEGVTKHTLPAVETEKLGEARFRVQASGDVDLSAAPLPTTLETLLPGVRVGASVGASIAVDLAFAVERLRALSGPLDAGGAYWDLFRRQRSPLSPAQTLVQILTVPRDAKMIRGSVSLSAQLPKRVLDWIRFTTPPLEAKTIEVGAVAIED